MNKRQIKDIFYLFLEMNGIKDRFKKGVRRYPCRDTKGVTQLFKEVDPYDWIVEGLYWAGEEGENGQRIGPFNRWIQVEGAWHKVLKGLNYDS